MALLQVTGLWEKQSDQGSTYYSGDLNKTIFVYVYENKKRKNEKSPTHLLYIATDRRTDAQVKTLDSEILDHKELLNTTVKQLEMLINKKIEKIEGDKHDWFYNQAD